jgi:hypothetical protein
VFVGDKGLARREPGAEIFYNRQVEGDVYPARTDLSINRLEPDGELPAEMKAKERLDYSAVEIQPELRGFAFCEASRVSIDGVPKWPNQYRYANRINGEHATGLVNNPSQSRFSKDDRNAAEGHHLTSL